MARTPGCADTPCNEPLPSESHGQLIWQKMATCKAYGGLSAHRLARRRAHAHSGWLIPISGKGSSGTQFNSQMERRDDLGCSSKRPRVLGLVELSRISSTVVC